MESEEEFKRKKGNRHTEELKESKQQMKQMLLTHPGVRSSKHLDRLIRMLDKEKK